MTATGCQALGFPLREHTLSQTLPAFGRGRQTPCCPGHARQLLHALRSYRALNQTLLTESPPLVHPTRPVPPESVRQEVPRFGHGYCATWRHCLNKTASFSAFRRFQGGDVQALPLLAVCLIDDEPQLHAYGSTLLCAAPSEGAVTGLSYPSTPGFPRCQYFQVSPPHSALSPVPQKPSCAAGVTLFRHVPPVSLALTFTIDQVTGPFPAQRRFTVAQLPP